MCGSGTRAARAGGDGLEELVRRHAEHLGQALDRGEIHPLCPPGLDAADRGLPKGGGVSELFLTQPGRAAEFLEANA